LRQGTSREELLSLLKESPLAPADDRLTNLYLYQPATILAKILYVNELYQRVMHLPGDIFEFGVWWGANISLFANLRTVYEPYNRVRKVVGFDTFTGYPQAASDDRPSEHMTSGLYSVGTEYRKHLEAVLDAHERESPSPQIRKYDLVEGRIEETLPTYLADNPQCFVALAYVDLQTYEGTKAALSAIKPRLMSGSVLAMDELAVRDYQGEAIAFREVFGTKGYTMERSQFLPDRTLITIR
jgi:hypothetical protein